MSETRCEGCDCGLADAGEVVEVVQTDGPSEVALRLCASCYRTLSEEWDARPVQVLKTGSLRQVAFDEPVATGEEEAAIVGEAGARQ